MVPTFLTVKNHSINRGAPKNRLLPKSHITVADIINSYLWIQLEIHGRQQKLCIQEMFILHAECISKESVNKQAYLLASPSPLKCERISDNPNSEVASLFWHACNHRGSSRACPTAHACRYEHKVSICHGCRDGLYWFLCCLLTKVGFPTSTCRNISFNIINVLNRNAVQQKWEEYLTLARWRTQLETHIEAPTMSHFGDILICYM